MSKNQDNILKSLLKKNPNLRVINGGKQAESNVKYRKEAGKANRDSLEHLFSQGWRAIDLDKRFKLDREIRFHTDRKWRFDFGISSLGFAIEIEGGTRQHGRHNRHEGYQADCHKYNEAQRLGWTVLRFTGEDVKSGRAIDYVERFLRDYIPNQVFKGLPQDAPVDEKI